MHRHPTRSSELSTPGRSAALPVGEEAPGVVWLAFGLVTTLYVLAVILGSLGEGSALTVASIADSLVPASTYAFPAVGALITLRRPRNPIGWLCLGIGLSWGSVIVLEAYLRYVVVAHSSSLPGFEIALVFANVAWIPAIGLIIFLILVFPDGRLPSPRWSVVAGLVALTLLALTIGSLFGAENLANSGHPEVPNPLAIAPIASALALLQFAAFALPVWILAAVVSIGVRYRRASEAERLQLKWLVAAGTAVSVLFGAAWVLAAIVASGGESSGVVSLAANIANDIAIASFGLLPIAIGVATLRHKLYDIDVIVNRTVVYGGATVVLAAAFGAANVASQRLLESVSGQRSDLLTGGLAVGAALAFGPLRRRIRPVVDRFLPARAELTLLFTDIVGSTRMAADVGDDRWRDLLGRYRAAVRRELARFGGREIDTAGDGFFATFDRPAAALRCAWAMRDAVLALGPETRAGLHIGQCEMRGEKVSGLVVNTAARVMAAAADGEILVSSALSEALVGMGVGLADRGVHELKGVPGEWHLYRVDAIAASSA
jgi:class 3 adenylate cyclase